MRRKPFIYICSPLKGDIERNIKKAIGYSRFAYIKGGIPLVPHAIFTTFLDDEILDERNAGIDMGIALLTKCDEIWVFGERISGGMQAEIAVAKALNIDIKRFNEMGEPIDE